MIKKPTQDLLLEHAGIILMMKIMAKVAEKLKNGEEVNKDHLNKILEFLLIFVDKCHHGKEEGILFPELLKNEENKKLINELIEEHLNGRHFINEFEEFVKNYEPESPMGIDIAVKTQEYLKLLAEHIRKENTILFLKADKELSLKLQEKMSENFQKYEEEVIGIGKHEEYHSWLNELKATYLGG